MRDLCGLHKRVWDSGWVGSAGGTGVRGASLFSYGSNVSLITSHFRSIEVTLQFPSHWSCDYSLIVNLGFGREVGGGVLSIWTVLMLCPWMRGATDAASHGRGAGGCGTRATGKPLT